MKQWSTLKKLIWLYAAKLKGGASAIIETITGNLPFVLQNAIQHSINSLTRYGLCTQASTPTLADPVPIKCNNGELKWDSENQRIYADGTPEVLTVSGKNLLNPATNITGYYLSKTGTITASDDAQYTDLIPVEVGERYTASLISNRPVNDGTNRIHGYDSSGNWVSQISSGKPGIGMNIPWAMVTSAIPSGIAYIRLSYSIDDTNAMVEKGNTYSGPKYQPYFAPQTASVPMLLSVGDVKDEVELIAGTLTRRVTACLYDGTQSVGDVYMSTTGGKDAGAIIVYPLDAPTTEQITAQNLVTNEGTNIVDSVANVSPLEAKVKYMTASAQDVLSTLLGMGVTSKDISTHDAEDMIDIITGEDNK